jgi:hypothetical protein
MSSSSSSPAAKQLTQALNGIHHENDAVNDDTHEINGDTSYAALHPTWDFRRSEIQRNTWVPFDYHWKKIHIPKEAAINGLDEQSSGTRAAPAAAAAMTTRSRSSSSAAASSSSMSDTPMVQHEPATPFTEMLAEYWNVSESDFAVYETALSVERNAYRATEKNLINDKLCGISWRKITAELIRSRGPEDENKYDQYLLCGIVMQCADRFFVTANAAVIRKRANCRIHLETQLAHWLSPKGVDGRVKPFHSLAKDTQDMIIKACVVALPWIYCTKSVRFWTEGDIRGNSIVGGAMLLSKPAEIVADMLRAKNKNWNALERIGTESVTTWDWPDDSELVRLMLQIKAEDETLESIVAKLRKHPPAIHALLQCAITALVFFHNYTAREYNAITVREEDKIPLYGISVLKEMFAAAV